MMTTWFRAHDAEVAIPWRNESITDGGILGWYVYMPNYLGYWGTLIVIGLIMMAWYYAVSWNEKSQKLVVEP